MILTGLLMVALEHDHIGIHANPNILISVYP